MSYRVISPFRDRYDSSIDYKVGDTVDWEDQDRIADCESRGLIEKIPEKGKAKTTKKAKKS